MTPRPTVLIIDDMPSEVVVLGETLAPFCEVLFATSGAEGLEVAARTLPDLIILDVLIPDLDGFEVCRRLKADPRLAPIPVLFLTIQTDEGDEFSGLLLGAVDYLAKPTPPALVTARVRNHLQLKVLYDQQCALVEELRAALGARARPGTASRICAWCRRVRNVQGAWEPRPPDRRGDWVFTVCPDCIKEVLREGPPVASAT
jgi:CheY-like chemotaxis protein